MLRENENDGDSISFAWFGLFRFCLANIVLFGHLGLTAHGSFLNKLSQFGSFAAILLFLVISGFSVGSSYHHNREFFFARRLARVFPLFSLTVIGYCLFLLLFAAETPVATSNGELHGPFPSLERIVLNLVFMSGILGHQIVGVTWSLQLEVMLYVLVPIMYLYKNDWGYLLFGCVVSLLFFLIHKYTGQDYFAVSMFSLNVIYLGFAFVLGFLNFFNASAALRWISFFLIIVSGVLYTPLGGRFYLITIVVFGSAIFFRDRLPVISLQLRKLFNWLGDLSFPLFMLHYPVIIFLNTQYGLENDYIVTFLCYVISVVVLILFDKPARAWLGARSVLYVESPVAMAGSIVFLVLMCVALSRFIYFYQ